LIESRWFPDLQARARVVVVEASGHILGSFASSLVSYVESLFVKRKLEILTDTAVTMVRPISPSPSPPNSSPERGGGEEAVLSNGSSIPFGLLVWSAGLKQVSLIESLPACNHTTAAAATTVSEGVVAKSPQGKLLVDQFLRVLGPPSSAHGGEILFEPVGEFALAQVSSSTLKEILRRTRASSLRDLGL
jgi:NADH dehydrogenase FAD-containing subunit